MNEKKQVEKTHYEFARYMDKGRWSSVWHQLDEVIRLEPEKVLEIGPGPGVFKQVAGLFGLTVETLDLDPDLKPDHVGSATALPFADRRYDVVCAFQMLEHLPYETALQAFAEMVRVSRHHVVISLPDSRRTWRYMLHLPRLGERRILLNRPQASVPVHAFDGEHYWEINKYGYELEKVTASFLKSGKLRLERTFRPFENPHHRFFIFSVANKAATKKEPMKDQGTMEGCRGVCSIVIPVFNREDMLAETVGSCLAQDYPHVEVILVNDGSTDSSPAICERLATERQSEGKTIRVLHQSNAGACAARNRGMALATGEFLLFLDSDDMIPSRKLSIQIAGMEPVRADCSISDYQTIDASGQVITIYRNNLAPTEFITRLKCPSNSAILMRRSSLPAGLQWNTSLRSMQDFDFMLRYLAGVKTWDYVPEPLYHYRLHEGQRISDSYPDGMPYLEMFRSMTRYLHLNPPATPNRAILLARYGAMLLLAHLKDTASRILPVSAKKLLKMAVKK